MNNDDFDDFNGFLPFNNDDNDNLEAWIVFPENCDPPIQVFEFCVEVKAISSSEAIEKARPLPWNEKELGVCAYEKEDFNLHFKEGNHLDDEIDDLVSSYKEFICGKELPIVSFKYRIDRDVIEEVLVKVTKYNNSVLKGYLINNYSKKTNVKDTLRRFYRDRIIGDIRLLMY